MQQAQLRHRYSRSTRGRSVTCVRDPISVFDFSNLGFDLSNIGLDLAIRFASHLCPIRPPHILRFF